MTDSNLLQQSVPEKVSTEALPGESTQRGFFTSILFNQKFKSIHNLTTAISLRWLYETVNTFNRSASTSACSALSSASASPSNKKTSSTFSPTVVIRAVRS